MRQFTVRIREDAFDALVNLAVRERRAPREQAALLLEETLRDGAPSRTADRAALSSLLPVTVEPRPAEAAP